MEQSDREKELLTRYQGANHGYALVSEYEARVFPSLETHSVVVASPGTPCVLLKIYESGEPSRPLFLNANDALRLAEALMLCAQELDPTILE